MGLRYLKLIAAFLVALCFTLTGVPQNVLTSPRLPAAMAQPQVAEQIYDQGLQFYRQQAYPQAVDAFVAAADAAVASNNASLAAEAQYQLGRTYHQLGRYDSAINEYQTSLELWQTLAPRYSGTDLAAIETNQALVITGMGRSLRSQGRYPQAWQHYDRALALHTRLGNRREQAIVLDEIANLLTLQGQYEAALRVHEQSLMATEDSDPESKSQVLNNIGVTYQAMGNYRLALQNYEQALETSPTAASQIAALVNIASVHVLQNDLTTAEQRYQEILELRGQSPMVTPNPNREAVLANNIGSFYTAQGRYDEALDAYGLALNLYIQQSNRAGEALARNNIGTVMLNIGDMEQAEAFYLEALAIYEEIGDLPGKGQTLNDLGRLYDRSKQFDQARSYYRRAIDEVYETTLANIQGSRFKARFADKHARVYARLVELLWDADDYSLAFDYSERARARAFLDQLANGTVTFRADSDGTLLTQAQQLRLDITQRQDQLTAISATDPAQAPTELRAELEARQQDYLTLVERLQSPQAASFTAVSPAALPELQRLLDPQTTLVEYFTLPDRLLAFVLTQTTFTPVELPLDRATLTEAVREFYEYDFATLASAHPRSLQRLQAGLMAPLQRYISTEHLTIVPHGLLHYVPFAALSDGQQYLIDRHELTMLPSANALRFLGEPSQSPRSLAVFGNPTFDLPFAGEEAKTIADLYGVEPVIGQAATEERLRSQASEATILHLATHGEYNTSSPLFSQLLLTPNPGDDGRLQVHEIYGLDLTRNTQLVVLSACQTQVGEASDGDEIIGLNRAFLYAGTPNVLATLWPISDEATADLMEQFYGFLQQGETTARALQLAQQAIKEDYPHPYYWAAFGLTGRGS